MGGGGKTTLARAVFDQISFQFEGKSFVENVREVSNDSLSGLKSLQNQVLSDVLNDKGISVSCVSDGKKLMKRKLRGRKILLVLDDVDHIDQLEALAGKPNWFMSGSRITITTRDEQVLVAHGVKLIYNVSLLSVNEAIFLFSTYAFGMGYPNQGYEELSRQVVHYAAGLPLTIRVLGSFLCGKNELEWIDALERLKTIPLTETLKKLELSYISLDEDYKEIFLDVACLLKGWSTDLAMKALESCGFHARNGLRVLEQKSLITLDYEHVGIHDHIEEMAKNIVRRSHPDTPNKHSRLWIDDEIGGVLANDLGTEATKCIRICTRGLDPETVMKGLTNMKKLRFLEVSLKDFYWNWDINKLNPDFPNALRFLCWRYYPFRSFPKTFQANNLVALEMAYSDVIQLWDGGKRKVLNKLRFLDLSYSMLRTLDLWLTPNLETLTLVECCDLVVLDMPDGCLKLRSIILTDSMLRTLDLGLTPNLETLTVNRCDLVTLHMPSRVLKLRDLKLTNLMLRILDIGLALNLQELIVDECDYLVELHMPSTCLNLKIVKLTYLKLRTLEIGLTPNLEYLDLQGCYDLEEFHMASECQKLSLLNISHTKLRNLDFSLTPNLKKLYLRKCHRDIQATTGCLKRLVYLEK